MMTMTTSIRGPLRKSCFFLLQTSFLVLDHVYILYDLTFRILLTKSTHSQSYGL
jgi:hypothetical protein